MPAYLHVSLIIRPMIGRPIASAFLIAGRCRRVRCAIAAAAVAISIVVHTIVLAGTAIVWIFDFHNAARGHWITAEIVVVGRWQGTPVGAQVRMLVGRVVGVPVAVAIAAVHWRRSSSDFGQVLVVDDTASRYVVSIRIHQSIAIVQVVVVQRRIVSGLWCVVSAIGVFIVRIWVGGYARHVRIEGIVHAIIFGMQLAFVWRWIVGPIERRWLFAVPTAAEIGGETRRLGSYKWQNSK